MFWLGPRVLFAVMAAVVGGALGHLCGERLGMPQLGSLLGSGVLVALAAVVDSLRGAQLLGWLTGELDDGCPRQNGFWGEAGARIERALRQREKATARERERLSQFLSGIEASPNGVLLLDAREQIEWCNQVAAEHLGLDAQRDLQQRITNLVRAPAFVAHLHGGPSDQPVQIPSLHGRGQLSILVRPYGDGQHLLITQDVTARERADATRRDFVANVSHEIRTPLTVLAGFVETMATLPLSEVERQRVLSLMGQQTRRMQALVGDLLTLTRLEGSPRPPSDAWLPLQRLGDAVDTDARSLSNGRHQLSFHWEDEASGEADGAEGLQLAGNEVELQSGVGNLVNNAVRYTPDGGSVSVRCCRRPDGALEIRVSDTGPGIAPEHLPRLTERFYRVDGSRSRDTGGTGLGLSIVKHVAQRHGGELRIASELGRGSTFTLLLPASRVRPLVSQPQAATASS
ncbi:MAG TPA: phosphate regulon sensor histidine kinase PhoR [Ideonella sp.]|uniref:phosphate regulon sensor histidine kinase PhoR n=1 Tax=Ideonella sp. TaxID=1929293 RepID=UPI002C03931B|nr:phosphate regulon sensor histidine kinase PhoR [Ideonella sp.]HSI47868.1 phosphate regulon sensor histidine kinase PhoR [Ideonella sp.]